MEIQEEELRVRLVERGAYDAILNPEGTGPTHNFEVLGDNNEVVVDLDQLLVWTRVPQKNVHIGWIERFIRVFNERGGFAGYQNWQVPSALELAGLFQPGRKEGALPAEFEDIAGGGYYWTADSSTKGSLWLADTTDGKLVLSGQQQHANLRLMAKIQPMSRKPMQ